MNEISKRHGKDRRGFQSVRSRPRALTRLVLQQQEFWLLGLACLVLLLIVAGRLEEHREISHSRQRVGKTVLALQSIENVTTLLLEAETAQRGFLLTGAESYLLPYQQVLRELPAALSDFEAASLGVGIDHLQAQRLQALAHAKLAETSQAVTLYRRSGPMQALTLVRSNAGQHFMEQIWQVSKALKQDYIRVFTRESEQLEHNNQKSLRVLAAGSALVLAILAFSTVRLQRLFRQYLRLLGELQDGQERYRLLAQRLEAVREEERTHLARELHDELGQTLTTIKLGMATAGRSPGADPAAVTAKLEQAMALTDRTIQSLRRIASELRSPLLDAVGLPVALRVYTGEIQERTGLSIRFIEESAIPSLSPEQRITAYRICQESLTNVLRHSGASQAIVSLSSQEGQVELSVQDNGQGFAPSDASSQRSLGLLGMEERAELVHGELSFESSSGVGTKVTLRLPVTE